MKITVTLILLLVGITYNIYAQELCIPCSQNLGSGFEIVENLDPTKNIQLVAHAVGIIAYNPQKASDGSVLISGYMPVCVVPFVVTGTNVDTCQSKDSLELYASSYLYEQIEWEFPDGRKELKSPSGLNKINPTEFAVIESPLKVSAVNKTPIPISNTMRVSAKKGIIFSDTTGSLTYTVYPKPVLEFTIKPEAFCREATITITARDSIFPDRDSLIWGWKASPGGESGISMGKQLVVNPIKGMDTLQVTLKLTNEFTKIVNCATETFNLTLMSIKPNSSTELIHNGATKINPADYESKKLKFSIIATDNNNDFLAALNSCPPDNIEADFIFDNDLFIPDNPNGLSITTTTGKSTLKFKGTPKVSANEPTMFEIEGYPTLGSKAKADFELKNIRFTSSVITDSTYHLSAPQMLSLDYSICKENNSDRFLYRPIASQINIFPNPNSGIKVYLTFDEYNDEEFSNSPLLIELYSTIGVKIFSTVIKNPQIKSPIEISLPNFLLNGLYRLKTTVNDKTMDAQLSIIK